MNNFKKHHRHPHHGAMDGFIRAQPPEELPRPQLSIDRSFKAPVQPRGPNIANFRRIDGYQSVNPGMNFPNRQTEARQTQQRTYVPVTTGVPRGEKPSRVQQNLMPHRRKRRFGWKKAVLRTTAVMVILVLLVVGFLVSKGYLVARQVLKGDGSPGAPSLTQNVSPELLKGEGDGRINILVMGKGGPDHEGGDLTDSLLLASIDPISKEAALLSIPRDLWVKVPGYNSMKINAVYATGKNSVKANGDKYESEKETAGITLLEKVVTDTFGVPIHYYGMVDFDAFKDAVSAVGGIDINVKNPVHDNNFAWQYGTLDVPVGPQHFDGVRALLYARTRYTSARGDFDRTERQREIILALKERVLSLGTFSNPLKISELIDAFGNHVQTNLTLNELKRLYAIGSQIDSSKITSIGLADPPNNFVTTGPVGNQSVVMPRAGMYNYEAIQAYIRTTLRDSFLKNEDAKVVILNGTETEGLASKKATELKSFGYNVTLVDTAPTTNYTQTTLIDLTAGAKKYTRNYLEKRLQVNAANTLPDPAIQTNGADFVIILGSNETGNN